MKPPGSSRRPRFNESSFANRRNASKAILLSLGLTLVVGLCGCKSSQQPVSTSSKVAEPEHTEIAALTAAVTDLRTQNVELRQALETALDAQEQLTNQFHQIKEDLHSATSQVNQISEELHGARDDLTLVREHLHDLELERETKPVAPSSGTMTAQRPQ